MNFLTCYIFSIWIRNCIYPVRGKPYNAFPEPWKKARSFLEYIKAFLLLARCSNSTLHIKSINRAEWRDLQTRDAKLSLNTEPKVKRPRCKRKLRAFFIKVRGKAFAACESGSTISQSKEQLKNKAETTMINKPVAVLTVSGFALAHNKVCILRILQNKESFYCC